MVSVKDFGAVGDGFIDDTRSIQAALDSGDSVLLPYGVYRISSSLIARDGKSVVCGALLERESQKAG
jgi:polygalacturonase